jgi:hypothetical protein
MATSANGHAHATINIVIPRPLKKGVQLAYMYSCIKREFKCEINSRLHHLQLTQSTFTPFCYCGCSSHQLYVYLILQTSCWQSSDRPVKMKLASAIQLHTKPNTRRARLKPPWLPTPPADRASTPVSHAYGQYARFRWRSISATESMVHVLSIPPCDNMTIFSGSAKASG